MHAIAFKFLEYDRHNYQNILKEIEISCSVSKLWFNENFDNRIQRWNVYGYLIILALILHTRQYLICNKALKRCFLLEKNFPIIDDDDDDGGDGEWLCAVIAINCDFVSK